ncbi:MAG: CHAP domain-containing protein [Sphingomonadaceae bacterium]|nr:CHAP domain-containing protein [Sphingomonadaceae bacterium]
MQSTTSCAGSQRIRSTSFGKICRRVVTSVAARLFLAFGFAVAAATPAAAYLQCAPYARTVSGIDIHGNAGTWWGQAAGHYRRGAQPEVGAVLAFQPTRAMPIGHVAVVAQIVDSRHILLNHANWSGHGQIERAALAEDTSAAGDWSSVRVWYAPQHGLGLRTNPTFGFIYNDANAAAEPSAPARPDRQPSILDSIPAPATTGTD